MEDDSSATTSTDEISDLRKLARWYLKHGSLDSAAFFAQSAFSQTVAKEDALMLANVYRLAAQPRRAVHLLCEKLQLHKTVAQARLLASQCLIALHDWSRCLEVLGDESMDEISEPKEAALLCLCRGKAHEALENPSVAAQCYCRTLRLDPTCYEAFSRLFDHCLLTPREEDYLVGQLASRSPAVRSWLLQVYRSRLKSPAKEIQDNGPCLDRAERLLFRGDSYGAYKMLLPLVQADPYEHGRLLLLSLAVLVDLGRKRELYRIARTLVREYSEIPVTWFAVGCYYYVCKNNELALLHFRRSTEIDGRFGFAWEGYGHAFSAEGEHDQAIAAFRNAASVCKGSHIPVLCLGIQLAHVNNFGMASRYLTEAADLCPNDPVTHNELGIIHYRLGRYLEAQKEFITALELVVGESSVASRSVTELAGSVSDRWESVIFNLGHSCRKLRDFSTAVSLYKLCLCHSNCASTFSALGFAYHLMSNLDEAILAYHRALALRDESFTSELLSRALNQRYLEQQVDW